MTPQTTPNFDKVIFRVAEETFGELAFMLVVPPEFGDGDDAPQGWTHVAMVDFTGPFDGQLFVAISGQMLSPLAANMLGLEMGEDPPEGVDPIDALKELLNVICGNLLPAMAGEEVVFHIGAPLILDKAELPDSLPGRDFAGSAELDLDAGRAAVVLFVNEGSVIPSAQ